MSSIMNVFFTRRRTRCFEILSKFVNSQMLSTKYEKGMRCFNLINGTAAIKHKCIDRK